MSVKIHESWKEKLKGEFEKEYFQDLISFVKDEYSKGTVYPPGPQIFSAFDNCHFDKVKVVIIGQDPYHQPNQANGLSFSVADGVTIPPSLRNIYKELKEDLGIEMSESGNLERWAKQGVLLLNSTLTVRSNDANSHNKAGWDQFTDAVINLLNKEKESLVFILWGAFARKKGADIDPFTHKVIESPHPSPFAAHKGFFGSKPFSKTNAFLEANGIKEIDW